MRKFPRRFAVVLMMTVGAFFLAGCATYPPPKETVPNSRNYGSSYSDVWDSVLAALSERNIQVQSMDKETGSIVAEDGTIELRQFELGRYDSTVCFCGRPEQYHFFRELVGEYTISVVRGNQVQTTVKIDASFRASVQSGDRVTGWHPCLTKGAFEPFFLEQVESQLANRKVPSKLDKVPSRLDWWKPRRGY
ncbi:MAG: hypothetical protein JJE32_08255 [Deltaproteobacteria bacterium]|nr:hypothetical protein [Deltaproteobacteria bacterium]